MDEMEMEMGEGVCFCGWEDPCWAAAGSGKEEKEWTINTSRQKGRTMNGRDQLRGYSARSNDGPVVALEEELTMRVGL